MLVLLPYVTDENRNTERLSILPQVTQLIRAELRTGPVLSNLESRCCDDPEGAAETRRPMLSQAHAHTQAHVHVVFTFVATEVRGNKRATGEAKGEPRSTRRRGHTSQEAKESLSW